MLDREELVFCQGKYPNAIIAELRWDIKENQGPRNESQF
jgi:hypothetical protein